ncbi:HdeA/HdeB family chaperone [Methylocystis sp. JAN1]|uniref:HdeA/HdeB family chaperone n=1 Tax=Methylocystis sp. JAN1 TaxID=3397211 RepID=UPI003FA1ED88
MKKLIFAMALTGALAPSLVQAQTVKIDMSKITCGEALAMPSDLQSDFAAFMSGFFSQKAGRTFIDVELFQKNVASVLSWCASNKGESVFAGLERASQQK